MSPTETAPDDVTLFCPGCGYDLRASSDGRCNECGLAVDFASLRVSAFPWAHRREMGRARAYLRTVWQVLAGSRALAHEAAKPQDPVDARSFARVTAAMVALTLLLPFLAVWADAGGMGFLAVPPNDSRGPWLKEWHQDVVVPWAAGVTLWPGAVACVVLFGIFLARAARPVLRSSAASTVPPERAAAIALYATAPLALLPLAAVTLWGSAFLISFVQGASVSVEVAFLLVAASSLIVCLVVLGTFVRVGQWAARLRHGGLVAGATGALALLGMWVAGALTIFGVVPWCLGFLWLVIDSLR